MFTDTDTDTDTASASRLSAFARRHQIGLFFVLACAFSWWPWIWYQFDPVGADAPILAVGPLLAALVMLPLVGGWPALRAWLAKIVHWRVGPVWYAVALLLPPAVTFGAVAINLALGAERIPGAPTPALTGVALQFLFLMAYLGLGEEVAWRGYVLPRLMAGRSALAAALLLGPLHIVWHLPLFGVEWHLTNGVPWAISVVSFSVVTAWIWVHTGGSLLMPILLHAAVNSVTFVWRWFAAPDQIVLWWIWAGLWAAAAVAVVVVKGPRLTRRRVDIAVGP